MLQNTPDAKFRQRYSGRRIEDKAVFGGELTHPIDRTTGTFENLPLRTEAVLDFGRMFNRLVVRKLDGKFIKQSYDREDILEALNPEYFSNEGQVLAPESRLIMNQNEGLAYADCKVSSGLELPRFKLFEEVGTGSLSALDSKSMAQVMVRGHTGNPGASNTVNLLPQIAGNLSTALKQTRSRADASWATHVDRDNFIERTNHELVNDYDNMLLTDYMALRWLHSSALSFIFQWRNELKSIASQTQYLSSELVGFYEKGLKGEFLRHYTRAETALMISLVELGAAIRRKSIVFNSASGGTAGYKSSTNLFWMVLQNHSSGVSLNNRMYTPWWLSLAMDKYHFEYEEDVSDVRDIHREDLFHGLRILLEAASYEYGAIVKSAGNPYLDFFADMDSAGMHDFTVLDEIDNLRALWMAGYTSVEQWENREAPSGTLTWDYFSNFINDNSISQTSRLDLQKDFEDLDKLPFVCGNYFKAGQQLVGPFEHTVDHRLTRFGSHDQTVKYVPYVLFRPMKYKDLYKWEGTAGVQTLDDDQDLSVSDAEAYYVRGKAGSQFVEWIAFPSIKLGWASFGKDVLHPNGHGWLGYGNLMFGTVNYGMNTPAATAMSNDLGTIFTPQIIEANQGGGAKATWIKSGGVALCPEGYWSMGHNAVLPSMILKTNEIYKAWQGRTSGLFRRSELKNLLSWQSYNVRREMKMNTPDALFATFGREIMGMMNCGGAGYDPALTLRHVNRKIDDALVHGRTAAGIHGSSDTELDADLLVTPFSVDANSVENVFMAQHLLAILMGMYSPAATGRRISSGIVTTDPAVITHDGRRLYGRAETIGSAPTGWENTNLWRSLVTGGASSTTDLGNLKLMRQSPGANEFSFFPLATGIGVPKYGTQVSVQSALMTEGQTDDYFDRAARAVVGKLSGLRTFYESFKSLDGDEVRTAVTPMATLAEAVTNGIGPANWMLNGTGGAKLTSAALELAGSHCQVYNFRKETVENIASTAGTTFDLLPGHMNVFKVWRIFETHPAGASTFSTYTGPVSVTDPVPSICTAFGATTIHDADGSDVPGLEGFQGSIAVFGTPISTAGFSNGAYLEYLETRSGGLPGASGAGSEPSDLRLWREFAPKLLLYDQDALDTQEGMLGALLYLNYNINHPGMITYVSVFGAGGDIDYEIRDSYGWGTSSGTVVEESYVAASPTGDTDAPASDV